MSGSPRCKHTLSWLLGREVVSGSVETRDIFGPSDDEGRNHTGAVSGLAPGHRVGHTIVTGGGLARGRRGRGRAGGRPHARGARAPAGGARAGLGPHTDPHAHGSWGRRTIRQWHPDATWDMAPTRGGGGWEYVPQTWRLETVSLPHAAST